MSVAVTTKKTNKSATKKTNKDAIVLDSESVLAALSENDATTDEASVMRDGIMQAGRAVLNIKSFAKESAKALHAGRPLNPQRVADAWTEFNAGVEAIMSVSRGTNAKGMGRDKAVLSFIGHGMTKSQAEKIRKGIFGV